MKTRNKGAEAVHQIPRGYQPSRRKVRALPERPGLKRWLIRAAQTDREVVVVDAISEDEALERAHSLQASLKTIGVWPSLPVLYAEEHTGPVTISWFREAFFLALNDQQPAT
jgi:hypothetical protein